jgi:transcriptional regulator
MYCPMHFQEDRTPELIGIIEQFPLASVVYSGDPGLAADHIPLMYEPVSGTAGKLIGHVARSNILWQHPPDQEVLAIFQGPSTYISPNWYATKADTQKVVPTWNYAVVHATGSLTAIHDPLHVLKIITVLTNQHEKSQPHPWRVSDAPSSFTKKLIENIVGIEITIHRIQGKWKVSQNQPQRNRESVARALRAEGTSVQIQMASLVSDHTDQ